MIGQGLEDNFGADATYNSLDIPVLVKYSFLNKPLIVGVEGGPQLSIPIGKYKDPRGNFDTDGPTFGAVAGVYAGYPLGPGRIIGDLRFLFDFNKLKAKEGGVTENILTRRGLIFAVGYEYSF
jgi:hypothetical protein